MEEEQGFTESPFVEAESAPQQVMIGSVNTPVGGNPYGQVLMVGQPSGAAKSAFITAPKQP